MYCVPGVESSVENYYNWQKIASAMSVSFKNIKLYPLSALRLG